MGEFRRVLAIETSCDDTSVAIIEEGGVVKGLSSASQDLAHKPFGGVVPEIAGRCHTETLLPLIAGLLEKSRLEWTDMDGIAVTSEPGLLGSLLVGVVTAKTLALAKNLPLIGVNHIEGHLMAPFLRDEDYAPPEHWQFPYLALAVSGGHSQIVHIRKLGEYQVLGATIDDAAGEAFDKFAKMLGLGYPGGVQVDRLAQEGDPNAFVFPRALFSDDQNMDFSFSGLKTAAHRILEGIPKEDRRGRVSDLCASFQEAVVDALLGKLERAVKSTGLRRVVVTGGVSANSRLRKRSQQWAAAQGLELVIPPMRYCTDNAAMIGYAGLLRLQRGESVDQSLAPSPSSKLVQWQFSI